MIATVMTVAPRMTEISSGNQRDLIPSFVGANAQCLEAGVNFLVVQGSGPAGTGSIDGGLIRTGHGHQCHSDLFGQIVVRIGKFCDWPLGIMRRRMPVRKNIIKGMAID